MEQRTGELMFTERGKHVILLDVVGDVCVIQNAQLPSGIYVFAHDLPTLIELDYAHSAYEVRGNMQSTQTVCTNEEVIDLNFTLVGRPVSNLGHSAEVLIVPGQYDIEEITVMRGNIRVVGERCQDPIIRFRNRGVFS